MCLIIGYNSYPTIENAAHGCTNRVVIEDTTFVESSCSGFEPLGYYLNTGFSNKHVFLYFGAYDNNLNMFQFGAQISDDFGNKATLNHLKMNMPYMNGKNS